MSRHRVLLAGWFSFADGEATAGDVRAAEEAGAALDAAGIPYDVAWSPAFRPGALELSAADPGRYSHLLFVCGPVHGDQVAWLHSRFRACTRIAAGVTVIDQADPACTGFDVLLPRDAPGRTPVPDLVAAASAGARRPPVVGLVLTTGQHEYGQNRRHDEVAGNLTRWIGSADCAPLPLDTRLDSRDWRLCSTSAAFEALIARCDAVVSMRLHGLVFALKAGVPAVAVDPVAGGGKVAAQAAAWGWPAVVTADQAADPAVLDGWLDWATSGRGAALAGEAADAARAGARAQLGAALSAVAAPPVPEC
jgi:Polysaccharide pyruvyl transferase